VIELLTTDEMGRADALAGHLGMPGAELMLQAGQAVKEAAVGLCAAPGPVLVLCGPGNNGGDGFVAARLLAEDGYEVRLALLGQRPDPASDAAGAEALWHGSAGRFEPAQLQGCALVVDALFGAGLTRDLDGEARIAVEAVNASGIPVLAVDVPSGVDGNSGRVRGTAIRAHTTVTFFRLKPGHLLEPGRGLCGKRVLAQIGVPDAVLLDLDVRTFRNAPALWRATFPVPGAASHKYTRGHALIAAGSEMTGAARLAARAALRTGAGLVTIGAAREVLPIYQAALEAVIVRPTDGARDYAELLGDSRRNALLIGPGAGIGETTRTLVDLALGSGRAVVLDADALTTFEDAPDGLFAAVAGSGGEVVLTPHEGEFRRLFSALAGLPDSKLERARRAAALSGAVVLLKGADTVVAAPDGRAAIADNAPFWLATAGSGDVLAGIITGLLAQGMTAFEAACAAVWMHGEAATGVGPGLIAEDLPEALRPVLRGLYG
jgi:hydroxyethylthiazole kinase-like uncharacterized protein yjeF